MVATKCVDCGSPEVGFFINKKPYCKKCADDRYEIQDHPFEED